MHYDLLVRGGTVVLPWGAAVADVAVAGGRFAAIGAQGATADVVIEAGGLHVLPGLIDPHVHFRDPGDPAVETIETGTRGAVLGGLTAVFDMPNTVPPIVDDASLAAKQAHVVGRAWCDMGLYVGATTGNAGLLEGLEQQPGVLRGQGVRRQQHRPPAGRDRPRDRGGPAQRPPPRRVP